MLEVRAQEFWFWPDYVLGQRAGVTIGNRLQAPAEEVKPVQLSTPPLVFFGQQPTERKTQWMNPDSIPSGPFTIEMWAMQHVNNPVGALIAHRQADGYHEPAWLVGFYGAHVIATLKGTDQPYATVLQKKLGRGWKRYFYHIVMTYDGDVLKMYVNGEWQASERVGKRLVLPVDQSAVELAAYTSNEPYMALGNVLKMVHVHRQSLTEQQINTRFKALQQMVEQGQLFPNTFHFMAGPYLNDVTPTGISLVWETDRPANFTIEYGTTLPLSQQLLTTAVQREGKEKGPFIYRARIDQLQPSTPYFYRVVAKSNGGEEMNSGILTFSTAVLPEASFSFAVVGDTEARPHVNDRVAKLIWGERPNFLMIVGDLTDSGTKDHKFQWNYEYFQGITQLGGRVAVFPVPGNGEDDLYWYRLYHALPKEEKGYYSFQYGNAEFFMLDSNQPEEFAPGGKQYVWLEERLRASRATWKFVAHHHAPYSADEDDYGNSWQGPTDLGDLRVRKLVPLFEQYGVDMVFFGHLHTYQRTLPIRAQKTVERNGVVYVQAGGAGGNLEDFAPSRAWFSAKTYRGHHYSTITINQQSLYFRTISTEGQLLDILELHK
jgi:hypothetical protein